MRDSSRRDRRLAGPDGRRRGGRARPEFWPQHGDVRHRFELASVTKPLVARAAQVAVEEGVVELDTQAGPPGSTVRHLLAHAAGYSMHSADLMAEPGKRRVYSNYGFAGARGHHPAGVGHRVRAIPDRGGVRTARHGRHRAAGRGRGGWVSAPRRPLPTWSAFAADLLRPSTVSQQMHSEATDVQFPGLSGVLPGFGVAAAQRLGPGLRDQGRQVAALDGLGQLGPHLRAFWPVRDVFVGRSAGRPGARGARGPQLRRLGVFAMAGAV